jgi:hypothetical protein
MQAFASPAEKGANYPTDGQGVMGKKRRTPLHENVVGLRCAPPNENPRQSAASAHAPTSNLPKFGGRRANERIWEEMGVYTKNGHTILLTGFGLCVLRGQGPLKLCSKPPKMRLAGSPINV